MSIQKRNQPQRSKNDVRDILGHNLRRMIERKNISVVQVCREMGINRTQFHRYLQGESWPRPEVLEVICKYFKTDGRIVLQHLHEFEEDALDEEA